VNGDAPTTSLAACLVRGAPEPAGYVSYLSALIHHGVLVDALAVIQVASPDLAGRYRRVRPGPVEAFPIPRDLYFGWTTAWFEGEQVPLASPEKALVDWLLLCEERGTAPRLEALEWDALRPARLAEIARVCGLDLGRYLPATDGPASAHAQRRARIEATRTALQPPPPSSR